MQERKRTCRTHAWAGSLIPLLVACLTAACGTSTGSSERPPEPTADAPVEEAPDAADAEDAEDAEELRVVALAEEVVLADLLALRITPVASSATVAEAGFQGLDGYDTSGIEVLGMTTLSLEQVAALDPDVMVTYQFWVDQIGEDVLAGIAELRIVPDGLVTEEKVATLGQLFDREMEAEKLLSDLEAARATATSAFGTDCEMSAATVYGGPSVAAWVDGPWELPTSILGTGCDLVPGPDDTSPDGNGRAWLSIEQLGLLDAPTLLLFQTDTVEGEDDSLAAVTSESLWAQLPAVQNDRVFTFDRLGYPGAEGQIRFLEELVAALDAAG